MNIIQKTISFVQLKLKNAEGGHDWFHIERVWKTSIRILAFEPKANKTIVELGALLHDIADSKFYNGDETIGPRIAKQFLEEQSISHDIIEHVINIIQNISYSGGNKEQTFRSLELDIVKDADRLDAIGAIGIARTFNYGGFKNRPLFNPDIPPKLNMSPEEYKKSTAPSINHFYEKLLLLKNLMTTEYGKKLAEERNEILKTFLNQFYNEWYSNETGRTPKDFLI